MSDIAIRAEGLGKQYRIGGPQQGYRRLTETVVDTFSAPLRRLQQIGQPPPPAQMIWALKDVSFEIQQGEVLGIIGRNGAGKSTLLKILSRITEPTEGRAELDGQVGSLLEVGTGFHPELTGRENIYLNGAILGMRKTEIDRKFEEIVDFAEIEQFIDTPAKRYSSGMYVRLAFAVAAHLETEILLVDEVLAVGDAAFQKKCLGKMGDVAHEGRTVLLVSHNMGAVSGLCTRVLLIENGSAIHPSTVEEGILRYLETTETSSTHADLESRDDRFGPSLFSRLLAIETRDPEDKPTHKFLIGSGMKVRFRFRLTQDVHNLEIGWIIQSPLGVTLHTFVAHWEGVTQQFAEGEHTVTCEVPSVNLFPGHYLITPWLKRHGDFVDDQVPSAIGFDVTGRDLTGHNPNLEQYPSQGVFQRSVWSVDT